MAYSMTLVKAKAYVRPYRGGTFRSNWAIYKWVDDRWALCHEGDKGDDPKDHPLWKQRFTKADAEIQARDVLDEEVAEAVASIQTAVR